MYNHCTNHFSSKCGLRGIETPVHLDLATVAIFVPCLQLNIFYTKMHHHLHVLPGGSK